MPTQEQISKELLTAMKSKDAVRTSTLRMLISSVRNKEVALNKTLTEGDLLEVIQSEAKRRREAIEEYTKAGRPDLASKEEAEFNVLKAYLPQAISEAELKALVQAVVASVGAKTAQDVGRVMAALMPQIKGRADGKQAQQFVREILS